MKLTLIKLTATILLLGFLTTYSNAESKKTEIVPHTISYIRELPSFARGTAPKQSKSVFWGKLKYKNDAETLGFHLYAQFAPEVNNRHGATYHYSLDIFDLSSTPKLINRGFLTIKGDSVPPDIFGMSLAWVDPEPGYKRPEGKTMPLLIIRSFGHAFSGGYTGIESFMAFPEGWKGKITVTNLHYGTFGLANDFSQEINTLFVGDNGIVEIDILFHPGGELQDAMATYTDEEYKKFTRHKLEWGWRHSKFYPVNASQFFLDFYFNKIQQ